MNPCEACRGFKAECHTPTPDGGALHLCWICAHHVIAHGVAPDQVATAECECLPGEIYPVPVRRRILRAVGRDALTFHPGRRAADDQDDEVTRPSGRRLRRSHR